MLGVVARSAWAAFDDFAVLVDVEMFIKDMSEGNQLVERGANAAEARTIGSGGERNGEADEAARDFVGGGFAGRPVELEVASIQIIDWVDGEGDELEAEESEYDGEVEIVEAMETEEHDPDAAVEEDDELVSVAEGLAEVEAALGNVDFGDGIDGVEDIPLGVGNE